MKILRAEENAGKFMSFYITPLPDGRSLTIDINGPTMAGHMGRSIDVFINGCLAPSLVTDGLQLDGIIEECVALAKLRGIIEQ